MGIKALKKLNISNVKENRKSTTSKLKLLEYEKLVGEKFGLWTILEILPVKNGMRICLVRCDCGNIKKVELKGVKKGHSKGCSSCASRFKRGLTHGFSAKKRKKESSEYSIYHCMRARCLNINQKNYKHYGGRGITICDRWKESFENFYEDMGDRPSHKHSLDRIDNEKGYSPDNCRWILQKDQCKNRRDMSKMQDKIRDLSEILRKYEELYGPLTEE